MLIKKPILSNTYLILILLTCGFALLARYYPIRTNRKCQCTAVADTTNVPHATWEESSCSICLCNPVTTALCMRACEQSVEAYAKRGCDQLDEGIKIITKYNAYDCVKGYGKHIYTCN